jgi:hypothetical protein
LRREELEHLIRACGDITDHYEFIIIGSQSILGSVPRPQATLALSMEADIYPRGAPELAGKIDGAIGEGSRFHQTHGYYAQGVGPETAVLPEQWLSRVHRVQNQNTNERIGYCLDVVDLFLSKAAAGRRKDREFCAALLFYGYLRVDDALPLVDTMPLDSPAVRELRARIRRWAKSLETNGPSQSG